MESVQFFSIYQQAETYNSLRRLRGQILLKLEHFRYNTPPLKRAQVTNHSKNLNFKLSKAKFYFEQKSKHTNVVNSKTNFDYNLFIKTKLQNSFPLVV